MRDRLIDRESQLKREIEKEKDREPGKRERQRENWNDRKPRARMDS